MRYIKRVSIQMINTCGKVSQGIYMFKILNRATDANKMDELEKKAYDEFIFSAQLARGKIQKIKVKYFKQKLTNSGIQPKNKR